MANYSCKNLNRAAVFTAFFMTLLFAIIVFGLTWTAFIQYKERRLIRDEYIHLSILRNALRQLEEQNYNDCLQILKAIPTNSGYIIDSQGLKDDCHAGLVEEKLQLVQQLRSQGKHVEAMEKLVEVMRNFRSPKAQHLLEDVTREIVTMAEDHYYRSDNGFEEAVYLLNQIGYDNPSYNNVQALLKNWQSEWFSNQQYWQVAQDSRSTGNLFLARHAAEQISLHPFWKPKRKELLQEIATDQLMFSG